MIKVFLVEPEQVSNFMQNGYSDLVYQFVLTVAGQLHVFLKNINNVRHRSRLLDASLRQWPPMIQPKKQMTLFQTNALTLLRRRSIPHFNRHFLEKPRELLGEQFQRLLDKLAKPLFAHLIRHR